MSVGGGVAATAGGSGCWVVIGGKGFTQRSGTA